MATMSAMTDDVAKGELHTVMLATAITDGAAPQIDLTAMSRLAAKALSEESRATPRLSFYQKSSIC